MISEDIGAGFSLFFCLSWITLLVGYVPMFLAFLVLRKTDAKTERVYKVPGNAAIMAIVPFIILMAIGVFLGIFLPYYYQKKYKSKEMERYKELLIEYDKYKEDMKDRTTHNKPEINWSLARQIPIK